MDPADILLDDDAARSAVPITACRASAVDAVLGALPLRQAGWAKANNFKAESGRALACPDGQGGIEQVLFGLGSDEPGDPFLPGKLARLLPQGNYRFAGGVEDERLAALGWLLEAYDFARYRAAARSPASLAVPTGVDAAALRSTAMAVTLVRDLVNTPANDLGPAELEASARSLAEQHGAAFRVITGAALKQEFPLIDAVGAASNRAPRLIDFNFGDPARPKLTLVGKGVTFDTGGLDIKPSSNMLLMKKDMGGAANVLGLASLIMAAQLRVRLRVLIPSVDNAIAGNAFRPGDVLKSRKGLTVEIGNTDAEGRLILADALALADEEAPDQLIDMATGWPKGWPAMPPPRTIRCGGCRCGAPITGCSKARSPISTMPARRALPARSQRRCFSDASSSRRAPTCISTFSPGRRRRNRAGRSAARRKRSARCFS